MEEQETREEQAQYGNGTSGTGGLLILYTNEFNNIGNITSRGTDSIALRGGASGGGSVNIFYSKLIKEGNIETTGGYGSLGGSGGKGSVKFQNINIKSPKITVDEITETSFRVNIENPNQQIDGIVYDYYINGIKQIENTTSISETFQFSKARKYLIKVVMKYNDIEIRSNNEEVIKNNVNYIIEMANKYDKYIYIDSNSGNDTTGNGSKEKPYATLDKIAASGIIEQGYSYGIILKDGKYNLTTKLFELNCDKSINIIGNKEKTKLYSNLECGTSVGTGNKNYNVNFYRLVIEDNTNRLYEFYVENGVSFYNVVFNCEYGSGYGYILPINGENKMENCTVPIGKDGFISIQYKGNIKLINCYGNITSGYGTTNEKWNYKTNYITSTPKVDSTTYEIIDDEKIWKNVGTYINPDGSQANLGVYGGTYSWEYDDDIF